MISISELVPVVKGLCGILATEKNPKKWDGGKKTETGLMKPLH